MKTSLQKLSIGHNGLSYSTSTRKAKSIAHNYFYSQNGIPTTLEIDLLNDLPFVIRVLSRLTILRSAFSLLIWASYYKGGLWCYHMKYLYLYG